jgi:hypothetical protein
VFYVLSSFRWIKDGFYESNANLVINITCVLLYLSRAIFIFECLNLSVQDLFLSDYYRPWFLWPETKKLVIPFLRIYLIASLLSMHCVSPHRRSHKPRRISTLKTKYHLLWLTPWPQPIIKDGSSIQGRLQDGANIEDFKYLSKGKVFSGTYLISITSLPKDEQTSKHGGGGRYNVIYRVQKGSK